MLVLSRKLHETIVIDDDVKVRVLSVSGKQVRLGIDAPRDVGVHREEIYKRNEASIENPDTTGTSKTDD